MSTYAIGDVQGCYQELIQLLDRLDFDDADDQICLVGDLVNRGPESLKTLRFIKSLGDSAKTVLGNHDLHLLAVASGVRKPHKKDTLDDIINADDSDELLEWLRQQPLLLSKQGFDFTIIHAGLPPQWSLQQAEELAKETEDFIKSDHFDDFLHCLYGNEPDSWSDSLADYDRYRFIINSFTRTRYITKKGKLDLKEKGMPGSQDKRLSPWYAIPERKTRDDKIIFGHWSTVTLGKVSLGKEKDFKGYNVYPLDTGCVWGGKLTAIRLEDEALFSVPSLQPSAHL